MLLQFLTTYLVLQLMGLAALPLARRLLEGLPLQGYAFARPLGIFLAGLLLWLGTVYGLLRNTVGGAWLALLLTAGLSWGLGWRPRSPAESWRRRLRDLFPPAFHLVAVEGIFLLAFAAWTWVRAHDPAINHTEQPMDLMFLSGIRASATFPPRDPWLAGYAISYYYLGYWLMNTVGLLAALAPEVLYNLGQAAWFGLLLSTAFGLGANLVAGLGARGAARGRTLLGGLLAAMAVGLTGNLQVILEWLYAQGLPVEGIARWVDVYGFPEQAQVTRRWYIDLGWSWWWRASRVIEDTDLLGNHIEVIDEFPIFSYVLGDNHPHVLAMPFGILVGALLLALWLRGRPPSGSQEDLPTTSSTGAPESRIRPGSFLRPAHLSALLSSTAPLSWLAVAGITGGLIFLNTWDFPPHWVLGGLVALFLARARTASLRPALAQGGLWLGAVILVTLILYWPYFLTAQSQIQGIVPNLFNPTRLPQFLLMFGHLLLAVAALLVVAWQEHPPGWRTVAGWLALVLGVPALFLGLSLLLAVRTPTGQEFLARMPLPPDQTSYTQAILGRWLDRPWTFLLAGGMAAVSLSLLWARLVKPRRRDGPAVTFALMLASIGLLLAFAPEFVYLRDNFGTRMNTVFKFYYQAWLLLGVAGVVGVLAAWHPDLWSKARDSDLPGTPPPGPRASVSRLLAQSAASLALLLILAGLIYPVAGAYVKIQAFGMPDTPTLDGLAYIGPDERALIAWIREHTAPEAIVLEAQGRSYLAHYSRISASTGRATLLGWDGHEAQWRGPAYAEMAAGRPEAIQAIYLTATPGEIRVLLEEWEIDYVVVGPTERERYGLTPADLARLDRAMDRVWEQGDFRLYRRRGG